MAPIPGSRLAPNVIPDHAKPRRARRASALTCEPLEPRSLLSTTALLTEGGTIAAPHGSATVALRLTSDRFTPAPSGHTTFTVKVATAPDSTFTPGKFQLIGPSGRPVAVRETLAGTMVSGQVNLKPGDYTVKVRGQGNSTGPFTVQLYLAGDANGDGHVDSSDLAQIRSTPGAGLSNKLLMAKRNLGANSQMVNLDVVNSTNNQFTNDQVYVSVYGIDPNFRNGQNPAGWVYFDASGKEFTLYGQTNVPNFTLAQAPNGIGVPNNLQLISARMFVGLGSPVSLHVNTDVSGNVQGVAAPSSSNPTDPNIHTYWDFAEFTLIGPDHVNVDTTLVDQFGFPFTLQLVPRDPSRQAGVGVFPARASVVSAFQSFVGASSPFLACVTQVGTGPSGPYRILAPQNAIILNPSLPLATYYNSYIQQVYTQYQSSTVTITVPNPVNGAQPTNYTFVGQVVQIPGNFTVFRFTGQNGDQTGKQYDVYSPFTPPPWLPSKTELPTQMVFANDGVFADNAFRNLDPTSSSILGNIENQVVSAMNRGVALSPYSAWTDPAQFYPAGGIANAYAAFWHQTSVSIGGYAYAFPYDDQGNNSTDMTSQNPTQLIFTVGWNGSLGG